MKYSTLFVFIILIFNSGWSQELKVEIWPANNNPIPLNIVLDADNIKDINQGFPSSWIEEYQSIQITITNDDCVKQFTGNNVIFTDDLRSFFKNTAIGDQITFDIAYFPKDSESAPIPNVKKINFSYTVFPDKKSQFPGGIESLQEFLKENTSDIIKDEVADQLLPLIIKFSINQEGTITETKITESSGNEIIDNQVREIIANMPMWLPAECSSSIRFVQEFEFRMGKMVGC